MPAATPIPAPPISPPLNGLLTSLTPYKGDDRWMNPEAVISYRPEGCNEDGAADDMCDSATFTYDAGPETVSWKPYILSVTERCSTFSGELTTESTARIKRFMEADTERQLGTEFFSGTLAQSASLPDATDYPNLWLANTAADDLSEVGPVALTHAMACLDNYLHSNNSGSPGAIHATGQTIAHWTGLNLLTKEVTERGIRHYSPLGNLVISSPGYSGGSPEGRAPGTNDVWAYATDLPRLFLGPVLVSPVMSTIDWRNNTVEAIAQRPALVEWQLCRHAAIQLAITVCGSGGS